MIKTFEEFTSKLAYGQLKNTAAVSDQDRGEIDLDHQDQILDLTNQGLIDITSRKKLLTGRDVITFVDGQNIYDLSAVENFVRLISVQAVLSGQEVIEANQRTFTAKGSNGITQPSPSSVRFTDRFIEAYGPEVDFIYQMTHPTIESGSDIDLPSHLFETLALYVAGLYLSQMGGEEHTKKGDSYYGLYLKQLSDDTINNTSGESEVVDEDTRFYDRGFV